MSSPKWPKENSPLPTVRPPFVDAKTVNILNSSSSIAFPKARGKATLKTSFTTNHQLEHWPNSPLSNFRIHSILMGNNTKPTRKKITELTSMTKPTTFKLVVSTLMTNIATSAARATWLKQFTLWIMPPSWSRQELFHVRCYTIHVSHAKWINTKSKKLHNLPYGQHPEHCRGEQTSWVINYPLSSC